MKASWNWLGEFVDLRDLTPARVAERLTAAGLEVEAVEHLGEGLDRVVTGRVVACAQHPGADRLRVCTVDVGEAAPRSIVCGAPNARAGLVVAVALPGARLPGGLEIRESVVRGEASLGMLCSEAELGLGAAHEGILELPDTLLPGVPLADALLLRDTVLTIGLTPNRADANSMIGIAREIAALFGRSLRSRAVVSDDAEPGRDNIGVEVLVGDPAGCSRYAGAIVRGVRVGPSPLWMQQRLRAVGQRPINNLVDVTNYAMFENGQPLHAFDLRQLRGDRVVVRRALDGETLATLDGVVRTLTADDLVIADDQRVLALAGVMGGTDSGVADDTSAIFIECAHFDPGQVRRAAKRHALHTESSHRFERGVDPDATRTCLERAIELVLATQTHLGVAAMRQPGAIDRVARPIAPVELDLPWTSIPQLLGVEYPRPVVVATLRSIDLQVDEHPEHLRIRIPTFRPDLSRPADIVEEIARLIGYDSIPAELPHGALGLGHERRDDEPPVPQVEQPVLSDRRLVAMRRVREFLVGRGLFEAVNWAMTDERKLAALVGHSPTVAIRNPIAADRGVMRTTLLAGLLDNARHSLARGTDGFGLFEMARVFPVGNGESAEPLWLGVVLAGDAPTSWEVPARAWDGHDLTGLLSALAAALSVELVVVPVPADADAPPWLHPGIRGGIEVAGMRVGWVGAVHPDVRDAWDIRANAVAAELDLGPLLDAATRDTRRYRPLARGPAVRRDVALLVGTDTTWATVRDAMGRVEAPLLESWQLFDVYEGDRIEAGTRSIALGFTYRDPTGTLTDAQADHAHESVVAHLVDALAARRR